MEIIFLTQAPSLFQEKKKKKTHKHRIKYDALKKNSADD
jgi:hypothetical protein